MFLVGVDQKWTQLNPELSVHTSYSYVGEFFFGVFSHCGDHGVYNHFGSLFADDFGWSPYVQPYLKYEPTSWFGVEFGWVVPFAVEMNLSLSYQCINEHIKLVMQINLL